MKRRRATADERYVHQGILGWNVTEANVMLDLGELPEPELMPIGRQVGDMDYGMVRMSPHPTRPIDLTRPCLLIDYGADYGTIFIDGYHRVKEAHAKGMTHLPMVRIAGENEKRIRLYATGSHWKNLDRNMREAA